MNQGKWRIRKQGGRWQVWRPNEVASVISFASFDHLLMWRPDCDRFLRGYCHCKDGCAW